MQGTTRITRTPPQHLQIPENSFHTQKHPAPSVASSRFSDMTPPLVARPLCSESMTGIRALPLAVRSSFLFLTTFKSDITYFGKNKKWPRRFTPYPLDHIDRKERRL
jgi:hypothetical protein